MSMPRRIHAWLAALVVIAVAATPHALGAHDALSWRELPPIPDAVGFAGPFAGTTSGALLVAGGANFPDAKPWEGGRKVWSDRVFVLETPDAPWKLLDERLPRPLGYGVSVTTTDGVVCVGGSDARRHYSDVFRIRYADGKLTFTPMPNLPKPCAN